VQEQSKIKDEEAKRRAELEAEREQVAKDRAENDRRRVDRERERERDKLRMDKFRKREEELAQREKDAKIQAELRAAVFTRVSRNSTDDAAPETPAGRRRVAVAHVHCQTTEDRSKSMSRDDSPRHVSFSPALKTRTYIKGSPGLGDTGEELSWPSKLEHQMSPSPKGPIVAARTVHDSRPQAAGSGGDKAVEVVLQGERALKGVEMPTGDRCCIARMHEINLSARIATHALR